MDTQRLYDIFLRSTGVSTDTRSIQPGMLFFALAGENFDGHAYAGLALEKGASAVVVNRQLSVHGLQVVVPDVLDALQKLATYHRQQFSIPVLGITGSNGKTTTKELTVRVLGMKFQVHSTQGNLNNHIGVPLTLLAMPLSAEFAVIEMGTNQPGEIAFLSRMVEPDYGLITNIGKAHLEKLGSIDGVRIEKWSLFDEVRQRQGMIFINQDDPRLAQYPYGNALRYGQSPDADLQFRIMEDDPYVNVGFEDGEIHLASQLYGRYNGANIIAAASVGHHFGVKWDNIAQAIQSYRPSNQRSQELEWKGHHLFLDAYNANPTSMAAAITHFSLRDQPNKVLILGDMLELGTGTEVEHRSILDLVNRYQWERVFLIGPVFCRLQPGPDRFESVEKMQQIDWESELPRASNILIKGSRGIRLERLLTD